MIWWIIPILTTLYFWIMAALVIKAMWRENPEIMDNYEEPSFLLLLLTWWMKPYQAYKVAFKEDWSNE